MNRTEQELLCFASFTSEGPDRANLQLYTLAKAIEHWRATHRAATEYPREKPEWLLERYVFTIVLFGTSVTQLLGQNVAEADLEATRTPSPGDIYRSTFGFARHDKHRFEEFFKFYDKCRHFGVCKKDTIHDLVRSLTLEKTGGLCLDAIDIWRDVIKLKARPDHVGRLLTVVSDLMDGHPLDSLVRFTADPEVNDDDGSESP